MKKTISQTTVCFLFGLLINSCVVTEYDCGMIETRITGLSQKVGTFTSNVFSNNRSLNFEEAAIQIEIASTMEENCDEEAYTLVPQIIESIYITSSGNVQSGGAVYPAGESLNDLFMLHRFEQVFSISGFITAQNNDPFIFSSDFGPDRIVLQLLDKPDISINQSFSISFSFTDSETLNVEVPIFEVAN